jgi:hypothetical protein
MNCSHCGYEIGPKDDFCKQCGAVFWVKILESGLLVIVIGVLAFCFLIPPLTEALIKGDSPLATGVFVAFLGVCVAISLITSLREVANARKLRINFRECDAIPPRHDCSKWEYVSQDSCVQVGNCRRCGHEVRQIAHKEWTDWNYLRDTSCLEVRTCRRCGIEEQRGPIHVWKSIGTEEYLSDTYDYGEVLYRLENFQCQRCGAKEQKSIR